MTDSFSFQQQRAVLLGASADLDEKRWRAALILIAHLARTERSGVDFNARIYDIASAALGED